MATTTDMHIGDIGTIIEVTLYDGGSVVNLSSATVKQFIIGKPVGATLTKNATFTTTGADGKLRYATIAGDLDEAGAYELQTYIETPAGKWKSDIGIFSVLPNI